MEQHITQIPFIDSPEHEAQAAREADHPCLINVPSPLWVHAWDAIDGTSERARRGWQVLSTYN